MVNNVKDTILYKLAAATYDARVYMAIDQYVCTNYEVN